MTARLPALALACAMAMGAAAAQQPAAPAVGAPASAPAPAAASAPGAAPPAAPGVKVSPVPAPSTEVTTLSQARPALAPPAATGPDAGTSAGSLLQTIFALLLVLGLLGALAWFLKRYGPRNATGSAHLRTVGALSLGGRERIVVVEVGDQWIVVGASPGRVNALATMPRQETPPGAAGVNPNPAGHFGDWLKKTIEQRNAK